MPRVTLTSDGIPEGWSGIDLAFLRQRPDTIERLLEHQRIRETPLPGGDTCRAERLTLDDGTDLFTKTRPGAPAGFFEAEAAGLRWLAEAEAVPVPEVIAVSPSRLVLSWIEAAPGSAATMARLGRALAGQHNSGAPFFGAPWRGFVGALPLDNTPADSWPEFYAEQRVRPYLRRCVDTGRIGHADARAVETALAQLDQLAGPPEAPARLHGDLWIGNVICGRDGLAYLVDPAAHGGHRETDLAMLALFGAPHLDVLLDAYDEVAPLAPDWSDRVAVHQLHPLLVHAALFGGRYGRRVGQAARQYC
jgi:fructosamine-3-kinase